MTKNDHPTRRRPNGIDMKIIGLLIAGRSHHETTSKWIANQLGIPLSTIQRRMRTILSRGLVNQKYELDIKKLGLKRGLIHINHGNGKYSPMDIADQVSRLSDSVMSISLHLGTYDVVCEYAFKDSDEVLDILAKIRKIDGVKAVTWSEEVYRLPTVGSQKGLLKYFQSNNRLTQISQ